MLVSAFLKNPKEDCDMKDYAHYATLAEMLMYPSERMKDRVDGWKEVIVKYDPALSVELEPFAMHLRKPLSFLQEYYVSTFYVQPLCCLDIGYILFGEDFRRGRFMSNLAAEHRKAGNDCGTELPDHLPVILNLLPKMKDQELAEELIYSLLIPSVNEMIAGFRNDGNHYKNILRIIVSIMESDHPDSEYERFIFPGKVRPSEKVENK